MLLKDRVVLVTGVLTPSSIAFDCARVAQDEGATVVLTSFGRAMAVTERSARRLPTTADVLELDVSDEDHLARLADQLRDRWGAVHGVVHAIGFAPPACLGQEDGLFAAGWDDVATALQVSAYSLPALVAATRPVLGRRRVGGRPRLRCQPDLAGLRLDGRGQGRARIGLSLPCS